MNNLFAALPEDLSEERFETIVQSKGVRIERIVSHGQSSPEGFWYDQPRHEWVVVLQGHARLIVENRQQPIQLHPGDYLNIPAHTRHRVEWTSDREPTIWLAVFYGDGS